KGLEMAGGGARVPVPANVGQLLNDSLQGGYAPSAHLPLASQYGGGVFPAQSPMTSFPPSSSGFPLSGMPPSQSFPNPGASNYIQYDPNTSTPLANANSALDIRVWPRTIYQGQTLLVYWTSVNMPQNS